MKNPLHKRILVAFGYLWGSVLLALLASMGFSLLYRLLEGGLGNTENLIVGAASLMVQTTFIMASFSRYGYRTDSATPNELWISLSAGGMAHFLVSIPFHFSMYTGGTAALYLAEYVYRLQNPSLPVEMPFTDIPLWLCACFFAAVESLVIVAAYVSVRRGQSKRQKEREELKSRPV